MSQHLTASQHRKNNDYSTTDSLHTVKNSFNFKYDLLKVE
jgi:hypothetical protein